MQANRTDDRRLTLVPPLPPPPTPREKIVDLVEQLLANNAEMRAVNDRMLATLRGGDDR